MKHADAFTEGVSDISAYVEGQGTIWIETKALDRWPKRVDTLVKLDYTDAQKDFTLYRKGWVLLRVAREYFLFDFLHTSMLDGPYSTQHRLRLAAYRTWKGFINWEEFEACLKFHP